MIVDVKPSPLKTKRFRATLDSGKTVDFGLKGGSTYIDHHSLILRDAYRKRHLGNDTEKRLINQLTFSPALCSYYLLWGPYKTLKANLAHLNRLLG